VPVTCATWHLQQILLDSRVYVVFLPDFRDSFWRLSSAQNGSYMVSLEILRSLPSNDIKFVRIGVRTETLWLMEVEASELFFYVFPAKIPAKRDMLLANRELRLVARVVVFLKVLKLRINL
jgi:hypothetical protein